MKRSSPAALLLLLLASCSVVPERTPGFGTVAELDQDNGFRGIRFGTPPDSVPGQKRISDQQGFVVTYEQDTRTIPADSINPLVYWHYTKGQLYKIRFEASEGHMQRVLGNLRRRYGPEITKGDTMLWEGQNVVMRAHVDKAQEPGRLVVQLQDKAPLPSR